MEQNESSKGAPGKFTGASHLSMASPYQTELKLHPATTTTTTTTPTTATVENSTGYDPFCPYYPGYASIYNPRAMEQQQVNSGTSNASTSHNFFPLVPPPAYSTFISFPNSNQVTYPLCYWGSKAYFLPSHQSPEHENEAVFSDGSSMTSALPGRTEGRQYWERVSLADSGKGSTPSPDDHKNTFPSATPPSYHQSFPRLSSCSTALCPSRGVEPRTVTDSSRSSRGGRREALMRSDADEADEKLSNFDWDTYIIKPTSSDMEISDVEENDETTTPTITSLHENPIREQFPNVPKYNNQSSNAFDRDTDVAVQQSVTDKLTDFEMLNILNGVKMDTTSNMYRTIQQFVAAVPGQQMDVGEVSQRKSEMSNVEMGVFQLLHDVVPWADDRQILSAMHMLTFVLNAVMQVNNDRVTGTGPIATSRCTTTTKNFGRKTPQNSKDTNNREKYVEKHHRTAVNKEIASSDSWRNRDRYSPPSHRDRESDFKRTASRERGSSHQSVQSVIRRSRNTHSEFQISNRSEAKREPAVVKGRGRNVFSCPRKSVPPKGQERTVRAEYRCSSPSDHPETKAERKKRHVVKSNLSKIWVKKGDHPHQRYASKPSQRQNDHPSKNEMEKPRALFPTIAQSKVRVKHRKTGKKTGKQTPDLLSIKFSPGLFFREPAAHPTISGSNKSPMASPTKPAPRVQKANKGQKTTGKCEVPETKGLLPDPGSDEHKFVMGATSFMRLMHSIKIKPY